MRVDSIRLGSNKWYQSDFDPAWKMTGKKAEDDTSGKDTVIQRVIREVGSGSSYSILTKTNYSDWAIGRS